MHYLDLHTGLVETRETYPKLTYAKGPALYHGFGHRGAVLAQLLLEIRRRSERRSKLSGEDERTEVAALVMLAI